MHFDLSRIFKGETKPSPVITAVVVLKQSDEAIAEQVRKSIADAGFKTDAVEEQDGSLVYKQSDEEGVLVRLSDNMLVMVQNMPPASGVFAEAVESFGFYPDLQTANSMVADATSNVIRKGEGSLDSITSDFSAYAKVLQSLPESCYKADTAVSALVVKDDVHGLKPNGGSVTVEKDSMSYTCKEDGSAMKKEGDSYVCPKCGAKQAMKAEEPVTETVVTEKNDDASEPVKAEEVTQKADEKVEEKVETVEKTDFDKIMEAISGLRTELTQKMDQQGEKIESIATKQEDQKKILDATVEKADTLSQKMEGVVVAPPEAGDRVKSDTTKKAEDTDPRRGNFDTAYLRRRR